MTQPTLNNIETSYEIGRKSEIKSQYGSISLEYSEDKEGEITYKVLLKMQSLSPEIAVEILKAVQPFFEDPVSPQLTLFPEKKEEE